MRDLYVLATSDDGRSILLGQRHDAGRAIFRVRIDDRLQEAVRGDLPQPDKARAPSALTPREIQRRLRAGEQPEEVATAAGVPVARVMPYALPIISEREAVIIASRGVVMSRMRQGASRAPLGEAVDNRITALGASPAEAEWTARRREDARWVVAVCFRVRHGKPKTAEWLWDPVAHSVAPLDEVAAELGHVSEQAAPVTRRRVPVLQPGPVPAAEPARERPQPRAAQTQRAAPRRETPPAARANRAGPEPRRGPRPLPARGRRAANRPVVPSWNDVLLGVRSSGRPAGGEPPGAAHGGAGA
jgi:hypothetical protein